MSALKSDYRLDAGAEATPGPHLFTYQVIPFFKLGGVYMWALEAAYVNDKERFGLCSVVINKGVP